MNGPGSGLPAGGGRPWGWRLSAGLALGILFHLGAVWILAGHLAGRDEERLARRAARWLQEQGQALQPELVLERLGRAISDGCLGHSLPHATAFLASFPARVDLPAAGWEVFRFDAQGRVFDAGPADRERVETAFDLMRTGALTGRPVPPAKEAVTIRFLRGGVGFDLLRGRPRRLVRLHGGPLRTWAMWDFSHQPSPTLVAGVLVLFHERWLPDHRVVRWGLRHDRIPRGRVGFLHLAHPARSLLPAPLRAGDLPALRRAFLTEPENRTRRAGRLLVFSPGSQRLIPFVAIAPPVPVLPRWALGLLFLWLPLAVRVGMRGGEQSRVALPELLAGIVAVACLVPLGVTFLFWQGLASHRRDALVAEALTSLEGRLVEIDSHFPSLLAERRQLYGKEFDKVRRALASPGAAISPPTAGERRPGGARDGGVAPSSVAAMGHPPPPGGPDRALAAFLRRLQEFELAARIDTAMVVSSAGALLRPFSNSAVQIRRIALLPPSHRMRWMRTFNEAGLNPRPNEVEFVRNWRYDGTNGHEFIGLPDPNDDGSLNRIVVQVCRDFIREHDRQRGLAPVEGKENLTSMVVGSFMDGTTRNPIQLFASRFGDFVTLGTGRTVTMTFVEIVPGPDGRGEFCSLLFHQMPSLQHGFLARVFGGGRPWPTGLRLYALPTDALSPAFPFLDSARPFDRVKARLTPPRRLLSEVVRRGERSFLLAGMACPHLPHYLLVATLPLDQALAGLTGLHQRLVVGGGLLLLLVILLAWRLAEGILWPAATLMAGVRAIEARQHQHRITLATGDEWERLAEAFNQALASLEELEVAHLVQTRLLPARPIGCGEWVFQGRSLMTSQIGGDYYDAWPREDGTLVFIVGDVSGHSVSAALVVAMVKAAFGILAREGASGPDRILATLNGLLLVHVRKVKMMTCFVGLAAPDGAITFSNAGQAYPYLLEPGRPPQSLSLTGFPLGTFKKGVFRVKTVAVAPGARLALFTDGLVEAVGPGGEPFSYPRLEAALDETRHLPVGDLFDAVSGRVKAYTGQDTWADDVTLALLERAAGPHATMDITDPAGSRPPEGRQPG
ncbi:MAG: serine/threonine-protein phosphatase [Candidatus Riflebacteria bacterium]|nr:serine/threonine-protein phosphatase [Candidatus Riflebacteria bacterium]